jgi:plastocyanin
MGRVRRTRAMAIVTVVTTLALGVGVAEAGGGSVDGSNFDFKPGTIEIKKGSKVTWHWVNGRHTVTFVKGSYNKTLTRGHQTRSRTFKKRGKFKYYCRFHRSLGMRGKVVVK